jgi:hypothetical protein
MAEDTITEWLIRKGRKKDLSIELAKQLASESRLGWYIAPHGHKRYLIGKVTLQKLSSRHIVMDDEGKALTFESIEDAKTFLRDELKILTPQVFNF